MKKIKVIEEGILEKKEMINARGGFFSCKTKIFTSCNSNGDMTSCTGTSSKNRYRIETCITLLTCPQDYYNCDSNMYDACNSRWSGKNYRDRW